MAVALTIAGSDSGGGAGIQGDLKTFEALGVFGTSVVTAVTAQSTTAVTAVHEIPPAVVAAQLAAVLSDLPPAAIKIGMLTSVPAVRAIARRLRGMRVPIVLDPVMVSKSGARLLRTGTLTTVIRELFPLASLVTPNLPEASVLAGFPIRSEADAKLAARRIQGLGPAAILIKGGHADGPELVDGLLDGRTWRRWSAGRIASTHTHGTGCALSSAVAALLARGETLPDAVEQGIRFVRLAIQNAPGLGSGPGPLGHAEAGRQLGVYSK